MSYQLSAISFKTSTSLRFNGFSLLLVLNSLQVPFFSKMMALKVAGQLGAQEGVGGGLWERRVSYRLICVFFRPEKNKNIVL